MGNVNSNTIINTSVNTSVNTKASANSKNINVNDKLYFELYFTINRSKDNKCEICKNITNTEKKILNSYFYSKYFINDFINHSSFHYSDDFYIKLKKSDIKNIVKSSKCKYKLYIETKLLSQDKNKKNISIAKLTKELSENIKLYNSAAGFFPQDYSPKKYQIFCIIFDKIKFELKKSSTKSNKSTRKGPSDSATKFAVGKKKKGNDGNMWVVTKTKSGVKRWKRNK